MKNEEQKCKDKALYGILSGSLCTIPCWVSSSIPIFKKTNKNKRIFDFLQTNVFIYPIIIYAFPHLANTLITRNVSSSVCPVRCLFLCHCTPPPPTCTHTHTHRERLPGMFRDLANILSAAPPRRYLLNLMARCLPLTAPPSESPD